MLWIVDNGGISFLRPSVREQGLWVTGVQREDLLEDVKKGLRGVAKHRQPHNWRTGN